MYFANLSNLKEPIYYKLRPKIITNYDGFTAYQDSSNDKLLQRCYKLRQKFVKIYSSFITNYESVLLQITVALLLITVNHYY